MTETTEKTVAQFIAEHGITLTTVFAGLQTEEQGKDDDGKPRTWQHFAWTVTLTKGSEKLETSYRMGLAHCKPAQGRWMQGSVELPATRYMDPKILAGPLGDTPGTRKVTPTPPDVTSVLDSLRSDAECYDTARDFGDFANAFGYDPDSRKAKKIYKACGKIAKKLRRFLGDAAYADLMNTERL